jgi:hypothetical protein
MTAVSAVAMVLVWDSSQDLLLLYCITCSLTESKKNSSLVESTQGRILDTTTNLDVNETTVSWEARKGATASAVAEVV